MMYKNYPDEELEDLALDGDDEAADEMANRCSASELGFEALNSDSTVFLYDNNPIE